MIYYLMMIIVYDDYIDDYKGIILKNLI